MHCELLNEEVAEFVEQYKNSESFTSSKEYFRPGVDHYQPVPVSIDWTCQEGYNTFDFLLGEDANLSKTQKFYANSPHIDLYNLLIGKDYYFQITAYYEGYRIESRTFRFATNNSVRTIKVGGVTNTRDLGGPMVSGNKRIKQGMVYRGANLDRVSEEGANLLKETLLIKTDLDLREESTGRSPLGERVKYIQYGVGAPHYVRSYHGIDTTGEYRDNLRDYMKAFADKDNYPIYFHCAIGRDRTGMVAMLLYSLLGVDMIRVFMDYELTTFSVSIGDDESMVDHLIYDCMIPTYEWIRMHYDGEDMQEKTRNYLLETGLTNAELNSIEEIMLEDC